MFRPDCTCDRSCTLDIVALEMNLFGYPLVLRICLRILLQLRMSLQILYVYHIYMYIHYIIYTCSC